MCKAYEKLIQQLHSCCIKIKKNTLHNKASGEYLQMITKNGKYQKVQPNMHQRNAAEKAISNFKNLSNQSWHELIRSSQCTYGVDFYHKQKEPEHAAANKNCANNIGLHLHLWVAQLQQNATSINGVCCNDTRQTRYQANMGQQCNQWLLSW